MDDWNAALRLTSVFAVIAFIALAASVYEIDRREKSSTDTVTANLADLDQQVQLLSNRLRISAIKMQDSSMRTSGGSRR